MSDIQPTMTDDDVMDFISKGYVVLERIIPEAVNRQYVNLPGGGVSEFVQTPEFRNAVLLNSEAAGAVRSLLGANFFVPVSAHHHLYEASHQGQSWHSDGLSEYGYGVNHLQCYYYSQDVELEDGPTMVLPGSHHRLVDREAISHYGDIVGQVSLTVPAGTFVMTHYSIWHKAGPKLNDKRRGMIKYSYFRNTPPQRDWVRESDDPPPYRNRSRHPYATEVEFYRDMVWEKKTWAWMCGLEQMADVSHGAKLFMQLRPLNEFVDDA